MLVIDLDEFGGIEDPDEDELDNEEIPELTTDQLKLLYMISRPSCVE